MALVDWQTSPAQMAREVENYKKKLLAAVYALAVAWAERLEAYAKVTAPWTDRTGNARRLLNGRAVKLAMGAVLILGHGVPYGIYLERRWAGRYAVINPTLTANYAAIMASLEALVA